MANEALILFYSEVVPIKIEPKATDGGDAYWTVTTNKKDPGTRFNQRFSCFDWDAISHLVLGQPAMVYLIRKGKYLNAVTQVAFEKAQQKQQAQGASLGAQQYPYQAIPGLPGLAPAPVAVPPPSGTSQPGPPPVPPSPHFIDSDDEMSRMNALRTAVQFIQAYPEVMSAGVMGACQPMAALFVIAGEMLKWIKNEWKPE